jgi:hypothetical protein
MCQPVTQYALDKRKHYSRVDLNISLVVVVRLDCERVVAETEPEVGLAESRTQDWYLCSLCEMLFSLKCIVKV